MVKSIFEIERRFDLKLETNSLLEFLGQKKFKEQTDYYSFVGIANKYFYKWPYRITAFTIKDYLLKLGIDTSNDNLTPEQTLYFLELVLNLCYWLPNVIQYRSFDQDIKWANTNRLQAIIKNIEIILEHMNYKVIKRNDLYMIRKRSVDVDDVILSTQNKELAYLLLSYLDFRNENSLTEKKRILVDLNNYIENDKLKYKSVNNQLYKDISAIMNNAGIRHKENMNPKLTRKEKFYWYDSCFTMILHLIREVNILEIQNELNTTFKPRCNNSKP